MDHKIYIYNGETYRLRGTCDRHNSHVREINYSQDSMYIQSDSADNEHLYFEAEDGEFFSAGSQLKDIKWADWTCIYGWPIQGRQGSELHISIVIILIIIYASTQYLFFTFTFLTISGAWPYFDDVENGRAFEPTSANRSQDSKLLAVGDTSGAVKLFNFPCISKEVSYYETIARHV